MAAGRRRAAAREAAGRVTFERRSFLLMPGFGERPTYDEYVIRHRVAAAREAPELGFAIPEKGAPYPRSSLPPQLLALRVQRAAPDRLDSLEEELYRSVFVRLEDVADPAVLERCATTAAVPDARAEVEGALADPALREQAFRVHTAAIDRQIFGIPAVLVPGVRPIVGAVPAATYRAALELALSG